MRLITLDFETYYDREYSLSKMTTEEYLNDPRFEVIGFGAKDGDGQRVWYSGSDEYIAEKIKTHNWGDVGVICHNTRFDGSILAWKYGIKPYKYFDTLSMARPFHSVDVGLSLGKLARHYGIGEKGTEVGQAIGKRRKDFSPSELRQYGEYCKHDCELTWRLFNILAEKLPGKELSLIDLTLRMYIEPHLLLDPTLLQREIELDQKKKQDLLAELGSLDLGPKSLTSNDQFARILLKLGVEPPTKISLKKSDREKREIRTWAFAKGDADFVALLEHDDPLVVAAVEARMGAKSTQKQTRAARFLGIHSRMKGQLPVPLGYYNAHTGRYGGEEKINLQNLQRVDKKKPDSGLLRKSIMAPAGYSIVVADFSQIEARMLAWLARQKDKVQAFADKRDVYSEQASVIYGRKVDRKANPDDFIPGFIGKAVVLGCGYGLGYLKFAGMIYVGMLGEKGILFDDGYVDVLGVNPAIWQAKKELREDEWKRILLAQPISLTEEQWIKHCAVAEKIIWVFRDTNPKIKDLWDTCNTALGAMLSGDTFEFGGPTNRLLRTEQNALLLPNGMQLRYEGLERDKKGDYSFLRKKEGRVQRVKTYGGSVTENVIQSLARIPTTNLMLKADAVGMHVVLQSHDEVGAVVPEEDAPLALDWMIDAMRKAPTWATGLPLAAEGGYGKRYGDIK
jgi:DNA polymerase